MILISTYSLIVLVILTGAQILRPRFYGEPSRTMYYLSRWAFVISTFFTFFTAGYLTYQQYQIWKISSIARLLLPPNQPIDYFVQYVTTHFWTAPLIAFAMAIIGLVTATILNRKFKERFFWPAEPWLFATALLLVGHPGWMYYLLALFASAFLLSTFYFLFKNKSVRFSFWWLWLPIAILTIMSTWFRFPFSN